MDVSVSTRVLRRAEKELAQTKVILRHLPPDFTKDQLLGVLDRLPSHDYFTFVSGNPELGKFGCARAYINFKRCEDIVPFRDAYDGRVLETGNKGVKYRLIIELAPYQIVPRRPVKPDRRCGGISQDPEYKGFLEQYERQVDPLPSIDVTYLHEVEKRKVDRLQATPLTAYLRDKYSVPRGASHRGGGGNKVLYATGSKRRKDRYKEGGKGKGRGRRDKEGRGGEKKGKEKGAESGGRGYTDKVIIIERGRGQNGHEAELDRRERGGRKGDLSVAKDTGGGRGGQKQLDKPVYVPGRREGQRKGSGERRKEEFSKNGEERWRGGGRGRRDDYSRRGRGQYSDRHDNHYDFKEDDGDGYKGPDYGRGGGKKSAKDRDYKASDRRDDHQSGGGRSYEKGDRHDNSTRGGREGRYRGK